jgi:hypothetical protein
MDTRPIDPMAFSLSLRVNKKTASEPWILYTIPLYPTYSWQVAGVGRKMFSFLGLID